MPALNRYLLVLILTLIGPSLTAQVFEDSFNDGNDDGWDRYSPLTSFGAPVAFSFPGGTQYRVQAPASPNPGALGPARGGAHLANLIYEAFRVEVDLVDWDNAISQDIGLLGSLRTVGLATTSGYAFSYDTDGEGLYISTVTGEQADTLGSTSITLVPGQGYRLVFEGFFAPEDFYGQLIGEVFALDDLEAPLATVYGSDYTYPSGTGGVFTNTTSDGGATDATFDNYFSSSATDVDRDGMPDQWEVDNLGDIFWFDDEDFDGDGQTNLEEFLGGSDPASPQSLAGFSEIGPLDVRVTDGELAVGFSAQAGYTYGLETSPDLRSWSVAEGAVFTPENGVGLIVLPVAGQGQLYLRVVGSRE